MYGVPIVRHLRGFLLALVVGVYGTNANATPKKILLVGSNAAPANLSPLRYTQNDVEKMARRPKISKRFLVSRPSQDREKVVPQSCKKCIDFCSMLGSLGDNKNQMFMYF